jgi:hypothetical protein
MREREHIVRYSAEEIAAKIVAGEDSTDWQRVKSMRLERISSRFGRIPLLVMTGLDPWAFSPGACPRACPRT